METTSSEEEQEPGFMPITGTYGQNRHGESPTDGRALRRSSRGSFTRGSLEDLLSLDPEAHQSSMWLGTEDGWYVPGVGIPTREGGQSWGSLKLCSPPAASTCTSPRTTSGTGRTA